MERAVILFTRVPVPGQTKTRMMPGLSAAGCARLHTCFLKDIKRECRNTDAHLYVCYTPEGKQDRLYPVFGAEAHYMLQKEGSLGERMHHAVRQVLEKGYQSCILIGADVPEIRTRHLNRAFAVLKDHDIVLGPTKDGGYYLVGMKAPHKCVFDIKEYGKSLVLRETMRQVIKEGLTAGFTEALQDMDTCEDLWGYRGRMRGDPFLQRTATGRYLAKTIKISVIIPLYNEAGTIEQMQDQLRPLMKQCEILFVDGGSTDGTLTMIGPDFKVICSEKGRAKQMNAGAKASHGDVLFFLHCDSQLPPRPLAEIRRVMKTYGAGCFGIAFHSANFFMFTCRIISNHRVKDRKVMFGDQGIFADRRLFFDVGMFPEIPIMEDYQFSLGLKERKVRLGMTRRRIYTSDRRFPKGTVPKLKLMWKMNRLRRMYRDQAPIEKIDRMYRDVR